MWVTLSQENGEFLSKEVTPPHPCTCIIFSCQKNPGYLLGSGYLIYNYLKGLLALYPLPAGARVGSGAGRQTSPLISLNHQSPSRREMATKLQPRSQREHNKCTMCRDFYRDVDKMKGKMVEHLRDSNVESRQHGQLEGTGRGSGYENTEACS